MKAKLTINGKNYDLPIITGTEGGNGHRYQKAQAGNRSNNL